MLCGLEVEPSNGGPARGFSRFPGNINLLVYAVGPYADALRVSGGQVPARACGPTATHRRSIFGRWSLRLVSYFLSHCVEQEKPKPEKRNSIASSIVVVTLPPPSFLLSPPLLYQGRGDLSDSKNRGKMLSERSQGLLHSQVKSAPAQIPKSCLANGRSGSLPTPPAPLGQKKADVK